MKISKKVLLIGIGLSLLSGCASYLNVTYDSDPQGAVLYHGQQKFGYTPYTLRYKVSDEDIKRGYMILSGTSVRWASGATAEVQNLRADLNQYGFSQTFNFLRPDEITGRDIDARFSLELERTRTMQRQVNAQERREALRALEESIKAYTPKRCTSIVIGNIVHTSCD